MKFKIYYKRHCFEELYYKILSYKIIEIGNE